MGNRQVRVDRPYANLNTASGIGEMKVLLLAGGERPSSQTQDGLNAKGITVTPVQDLATCLATLKAERDWSVIIDLDLYRTGIEALQEIRRISPDIVVIAMASLERLSVVDEALKHGALDFVIKQPDLSHLQEIPQAITRNMEWKRLQSEMQSSQQESQWIMAALGESRDGIFVAAPEGKIIFANPALCSRLGFHGDELIGEPTETILPSLEADESSWIEVPQPFPHRKWQGTVPIKKKDGSESSVTTRMTKILDGEGKVRALIGICLQPEEQVPRAPVGNPEGEVASDELITHIMEDLKSPLGAMITYLEIASAISPERAGPNQLLSIKRIEALARRLLDLVNDHTMALEIKAGKLEIHKSVFQINQILELAVQGKKSEASAKNIEIVLETTNDLPPISIDSVQIEHAVGILISNAIGLSPLGGSVTVTSKLNGNETVVAIKDSGAGIPKEEVPFLFDRKKRLPRPGGDINTVGLYVAHHIVTRHDGKIDVRSDPLGTTLTISLPV